jgi:hypothetical protein
VLEFFGREKENRKSIPIKSIPPAGNPRSQREKKLTGEGLVAHRKSAPLPRGRAVPLDPVRIGMPWHWKKNMAVEGAPCLRHGRRERFPLGGKDTATPIFLCSMTLRRLGERKRRVSVDSRRRHGELRPPPATHRTPLRARIRRAEAPKRNREEAGGKTPPRRRGVPPSPVMGRRRAGRRGSASSELPRARESNGEGRK